MDEALPEQEIQSLGLGRQDAELLETLLQDIREAGRDAMAEPDWSTAFYQRLS